MAPKELEGGNLGEKHRSYNKRLRESQQGVADTDDGDINTLLKIDIACRNKDVNYILNILKSEDMLFVSRAITRCTWLYTDKDYANIINPEYLQAELFPNMTIKALTKFKKQIRLNIKDENRAEQFYLKETKKSEACKWLPNCSVAFVESHIEEHVKSCQPNTLKLRLFKRLCEKSISIFELILKHLEVYNRHEYLQVVTFVLNTNVDKYLDVLENTKYRSPKLNRRATELIIKHSKTRVIEKMEKYVSVIHLPTFVQYLKVDEIKKFLYLQAKKDMELYEFRDLKRLFQCDTLKLFINKLPKDEQFGFVKSVCMRDNSDEAFFEYALKETASVETEASVMKRICDKYCKEKSYVWYQFAPFDHAFTEITKLISQNVESHEKLAMLSVLIKCANRNLKHIQTILDYFINKQKSEDTSTKTRFVTAIINRTDVSEYDAETWNVLNKLLKSINVYDSSSNALSSYDREIVNFIIIYNTINDQETPEVIKALFKFDTLKSYKNKMNQGQKDKLFNFLYNYQESKVNSPIVTKTEFTDSMNALRNMLVLLKDWDKALLDYPIILSKIKELIQLKKEHSWKVSLSTFYNVNKAWRKHMFEESVALCPGEEVCLNALKHEPQLLTRHNEDMGNLKADDTISLKRFLSKLRIYWPQTIAQEWTEGYLNNINETKGQKAAVLGVISMLPQEPLVNIIKKYKPAQPKIDWKQADDRVISVQRLIAKNMHRARPHPNPEAILSYAKGDYLQFALPSLLAIFNNLKFPMVRQYIPKLLDAPVSLQKHGIRIAFKKFSHEELHKIFLNCWKNSKNATIRSIIFKYTHTLLCNEKDEKNATGLWELLETFIDNLTFTEDKDIYKLFDGVANVPLNVRAQYLVKTYNFLKKLIPKLEENDRSQYEWICTHLAAHTRTVMETIDSDFVTGIIQEFIDEQFFKNSNSKYGGTVHQSNDMVQVLSAYLLCSKHENDQIKTYEKVFVPLMKRSFEKWGEKHKGTYFVRQNFDQVLIRLSYDLKDYVIEKNMMIPIKMFTLILNELEKSLSVTENYMVLTKWKLTVTLAQLTKEYAKENNKIIPIEFGKSCLKYLKQDVELHFPCIYVLFSKCVRQIMYLITDEDALQFYEAMLSDKDFIQGYLSSIEIGLDNRQEKTYDPIWKQIVSHPSVEVKMHYYNKIDKNEK